MTEYFVEAGAKGDGSAVAPFGTLNQAAKAVKSGDVVNIRTGVYREKLNANVAKVTWRAAEEHEPVIDGGWKGEVVKGFSNQVAATAEGVEIRGLTVRNCRGRGIAALANNVRIINNRIDLTYHGGMIAGDAAGKPISGLLIENNVMTRMSQSFTTEKQFDGVNGSFNILNVRDSIVRFNVLSHGHGEGYNLGRGSMRVLLYKNIAHTTQHGPLYFNHCIECEARENILYHTFDPRYHDVKDDDVSAGVIIGDERTINAKFIPQRGNKLIGNLIVCSGVMLDVRNGSNPDRGYDTQLDGMIIEYNTFVAGSKTREGIDIAPNQLGRPHKDSVFANNVIYFTGAKPGAPIGKFSGPGVAFHHNAWSEQPPAAMRGDGDIYGDLALVDPGAVLQTVGEPPLTNFDIDHYRPATGSQLIGAAADGGVLGALAPTDGAPPIDPPIDPPEEPTPPDPPEEPEEPEPSDAGEAVALVEEAIAALTCAKQGIANAESSLAQLLELLDAGEGGE